MSKVLEKLESLIADGSALIGEWRSEHSGSDPGREVRARKTQRWTSSCEHFFEYMGMPSFKKRFQDVLGGKSYAAYTFSQLVGILESAKDEISSGLLGNIRHLLHADMFASIVEQASELLEKGHLTPAAVLGRIVIERWLRDLGEKSGVADYGTIKAATLNERLKGAGIFSTAKWGLVQGFLGIGNAAAHGKEDQFSRKDVEQMLEFARANCL